MTAVPFHILVVDDEASQREILAGYLMKKKFTVRQAKDVDAAVKELESRSFDLVLTDYRMPGKSGVDLLRVVRERFPETAVVVMTAFGTIEQAVEAMRLGAFDYLSKPIDLDALDLVLGKLQLHRRLVSENQLLKEQLAERMPLAGIIAQSPKMQSVLSTASRVAVSRAPVLVRGESGTGKELIARAIHAASERKDRPFVAVNCAALNDNLLESELFGHEKGAFTGADKQRRGRFELADGGTLFLDEIGDISPATQVRLLRVLQERTFERVGGSETITVDVRIIAATHRNLEQSIAAGTFREDLFYRLNVVSVEIPSLRERRDDIPLLLDHFLERFSREHRGERLTVSREAWDLLLRYPYPGNVRELENIVQRAVILSRGDVITTEDLPAPLRSTASDADVSSMPSGNFDEQVERLEKQLIFDALRSCENNQTKAAEVLGLSERNIRYRLKKWGVK